MRNLNTFGTGSAPFREASDYMLSMIEFETMLAFVNFVHGWYTSASLRYIDFLKFLYLPEALVLL